MLLENLIGLHRGNMRILITGSMGFIGSVLTQRALDNGHSIIALDNGDRGLNKVKRSQMHLMLAKRDCRGGISDILERYPCDAIVHLAWCYYNRS